MRHFNRLVRDARKLFRDLNNRGLLVNVTYKQQLDHEYDVATGNTVENFAEIPISMLLTSYGRRELTNEVRATDVKAVYLKSELKVAPQIDDSVFNDDQVYRVVSFNTDVQNPFAELQLRGA